MRRFRHCRGLFPRSPPERRARKELKHLKVTKFGGTSCADAAQFRKVKEIVEADPERRIVVVSAPGKRFSADHKITDVLYLCHRLTSIGLGAGEVFEPVRRRFLSIRDELGLDVDLENEFAEIERRLMTGANADYAASRGEYLSAKLMAAYLGYEFCDAKELVRFDERGKYDEQATMEAIGDRLDEGCFVVPGFYGSNRRGEIITFSRGGSDITGSILAQALEADVYENWTDVSGFLAADPRIVENPQPIRTVTYDELRELSYMGAPVLHEEAIFPARKSGIPIHIRNTNHPEDAGTRIVPEREPGKLIVTGIAGVKDFTVITVRRYRMSEELSFLRRVASVFEANGVAIHHMPSSIDSLSIVVKTTDLVGKEKKILEEIDIYCGPVKIEPSPGLSLVAIVGEAMARHTGVSARVFGALAKAGVNIRMITQGASELNIIVGIENNRFEDAIRAIYGEFF